MGNVLTQPLEIDGPVLRINVDKIMSIAIRLSKNQREPVAICIHKPLETQRFGKLMYPESKSKFSIFQNLSRSAQFAMATYSKYHSAFSVIPFIEWLKHFRNLYKEKCQLKDDILAWDEHYGFLPPNYHSIDLEENFLLHHGCNSFK